MEEGVLGKMDERFFKVMEMEKGVFKEMEERLLDSILEK